MKNFSRNPKILSCLLLALGVGAGRAQVVDWSDSFESYTVGSAVPGPWSGDGNGASVTAAQSHTGGQAMQLVGSGNCWEGLAYRELPAANAVFISFAVKQSNNRWSGCHPWHFVADLGSTRSWTSATFRSLFGFSRDTQTIRSNTENLGSWQPDQWYVVGILYEKVATNIWLTYWIDGVKTGPISEPIYANENDLKYLVFGSGESTVWVDDVQVTIGSPTKHLELQKVQLKVNFATNKLDSASFKGSLEMPVERTVGNVAAELSIGSVTVPFTLDGKGRGLNGSSKFKLTRKGKPVGSNQLWQVSAKLMGDWDSVWASDGLINATTNLTLTVPVQLSLETAPPEVFSDQKVMLYKATTDKSGQAK